MSRSHGLLQLSDRIFNTPQFMTQDTFERLSNYVIDRNSGSLAWQVNIDEQTKEAKIKSREDMEGKILALNPLKANSFKRPDFSAIAEADRERAEKEYLNYIQYDPTMQLGILNIEGTTTYRSTPFEAMCGMTSYQRLERTMKAQLAEGAKTVLLYVDSGGGEAYGMIETAQNLRALADAGGAKIIAYVDGTSGSAGYGLTAIADEVIANPSARVGSIGVVVSLMNNSKQLEKEGLERIYLYKGNNKVALDSDGNFSESFLNTIDEMITESYRDFTSHVASARGMSVQQVVDTQASVYTADKALKVGLVDKVMTRSDFFDTYLMGVVASNNTGNYKNPYKMVAKTVQTDEVNNKMDIQDIVQKAVDDAGLDSSIATQADAPVVTEEATVAEPVVEAPLASAVELALQASIDELQASVSANADIIAQLTERAETAEKALSDLKHDQLISERKAQLSTVLASDKVEANMAFAGKLSADDFSAYMETLSSIYTTSKEDMKEVGAKAEDIEPAQTFDDIMKAKIQQSNKANA